MSTLTIDFPQELYKRLEEQARKEGQEPEVFSRALIEFALQARENHALALPERSCRRQVGGTP